MNLFDGLQDTMFSCVTNAMGYDAIWMPSLGGLTQTARVLFTGPTDEEKLNGANFEPDKLDMEYKKGDFIGLEELADNNIFETIAITGIGNFIVKSITKKFDGKNLIARLKAI